jgi:hypothetical protein
MRREIVATQRAGVTTPVVMEISPKDVHQMLDHDWNHLGTLTKQIRRV